MDDAGGDRSPATQRRNASDRGSMNNLWIVGAAIVALAVIARIRTRRKVPQRRSPPASGPRIQGFQMVAYVHPRMSAACLFDHGMQFGKGFRRKEGPPLPHDAACRCESQPFSFTSSEVFNGALRNLGAVHGSIAGLAAADAQHLIERLKAVEARPLPAEPGAYARAVDVESFPASIRAALEGFLVERHAYLLQTPREGGAATEPNTPERLQSPEPTR
jgi:hypothetical protein